MYYHEWMQSQISFLSSGFDLQLLKQKGGVSVLECDEPTDTDGVERALKGHMTS